MSFGGEDFKDILERDEYVFRDSSNNCFTVEDFRNFLLQGKENKNPYTGSQLWKTETELNYIVNATDRSKPIFTEEEKKEIINTHYPKIIESKDLQRFIDLIGWTGCILKADNTTLFGPSDTALTRLSNELKKEPDNLKEKLYGLLSPLSRSQSLKDILSCTDTCVHGIGSHLLSIYLENTTTDIIPCLVRVDEKTVIFPYSIMELEGTEYKEILNVFIVSPSASNYVYYSGEEWYPDYIGHKEAIKKISESHLKAIDSILNYKYLSSKFDELLSYCKKNSIPPLL